MSPEVLELTCKSGALPALADHPTLQRLTSLTALCFASSGRKLPALGPSWSALQHLKELRLHALSGSISSLGAGARLFPGLRRLSCRARDYFHLDMQAVCRLTALEELDVRCKHLVLDSPVVDALHQLQKLPNIRIASQAGQLL